MPPLVDLVEHGRPQEVELSEEQYEALRGLKIAGVTRISPGSYSIKPGQKVGSIRLGPVQINIRPKIAELNRLLFFIGYSSSPSIWRDEFVRLEKADGLFPAVSESFVRLASDAFARGLLRGYRSTTDSLSVVRGRVRFQEQITRNYGLPVPIAVQYDDFTADVAENRVILLATLRLLALPDIGAAARQQLNRIRAMLDEITTVPMRAGRPKFGLNRLNVRYHDVLRLSEVILDNGSFGQDNGPLAVSGFMFDMWKIYEDFVTGALSMAMQQYGGYAKTQTDHYMDRAARIKFIPDLVWCDADGLPVAVVDAKYKAEKPKGFPEADLYQMLAYCAVLGLEEGHLIYARGNEPATVHAIKTCNVTIHCHALDLSLPPNDLLKTIDSLAKAILGK
ncbi:McrC family protein [Nocardia sp. NPDC057440]|uniref:McrC family protein n=1 Tax=Nocardia sp. NPDC057440 TaxID=3346134 RepID=UPI003671D900